jgi:hypothetical protein
MFLHHIDLLNLSFHIPNLNTWGQWHFEFTFKPIRCCVHTCFTFWSITLNQINATSTILLLFVHLFISQTLTLGIQCHLNSHLNYYSHLNSHLTTIHTCFILFWPIMFESFQLILASSSYWSFCLCFHTTWKNTKKKFSLVILFTLFHYYLFTLVS